MRRAISMCKMLGLLAMAMVARPRNIDIDIDIDIDIINNSLITLITL
jgi:hypothetical protein